MKIKELITEIPEMTEEKLLELIRNYSKFISKDTSSRLEELYIKRHGGFQSGTDLTQMILDEWNIIQEKKSLLTKSQRDQICGLVAMCLIKMTKGDE